jgi:GrpB-like predicted nucleotidyltransferase (UPF0157 family)
MSTVSLLPYSSTWPAIFSTLHDELLAIFKPQPLAVEHIGSTAVPGLCAKPVIDILLGAASLSVIEQQIPALQRAGFQYRSGYEVELPDRRYFVRSTPNTLRVHVHAVQQHSTIWTNHLDFRDKLRVDPALMHAYAELKQKLAQTFRDDKAAYTEAKGPFISATLASR